MPMPPQSDKLACDLRAAVLAENHENPVPEQNRDVFILLDVGNGNGKTVRAAVRLCHAAQA